MTSRPARGRPTRRALLTAAMLGCLAVLVGETVVGLGAAGDAIVGRFADDLVIALAASLCLLRAHAEPHGRRGPWMLLTCALVAWALGNGFQSLALWGRPYTGATLSDAGWIALYPLSALAFLALARAQLGRLDLRLGIDAVIAALALLAFSPAISERPRRAASTPPARG